MEHLSEHWGSQLRIEALVYDSPKGAYLIKTLSSLTRCKTASPIILQRNNPGSSLHTYVGLSSSSHGSCSALLARIASHLTHPSLAIFIRIYQGWPLDLQEGPLPVHQANPGIPHLSPGHWLGQTAPSREPGHWSPLINLGFGRLVSDFQGEPGVSLCPPSTLLSWGTPLRSWPWIFPRHWSPRIDLGFGRPSAPATGTPRTPRGRTEAARVGLLLCRQKLGSRDDFQWIAASALLCHARNSDPESGRLRVI